MLAFFAPAFFAFSTSFDSFSLSMTKNSKILPATFLQKLYPFPKIQRFFLWSAAPFSLRNFFQIRSLPKVIHILHKVFHICLTIDISCFQRILYFFGIPCDGSFPHPHRGSLFYIKYLPSTLSPFVFVFSSGQTIFCKAFPSCFQKKQVCLLYIHFFHFKIYKKGRLHPAVLLPIIH